MTKRRERKKNSGPILLFWKGVNIFSGIGSIMYLRVQNSFFLCCIFCVGSLIKKNRTHKKSTHTHKHIHTRRHTVIHKRVRMRVRAVQILNKDDPRKNPCTSTSRLHTSTVRCVRFIRMYMENNECRVKHGLIHSVVFFFFILLLTKKETESKIYRKIQTHTHSYIYLYKYI